MLKLAPQVHLAPAFGPHRQADGSVTFRLWAPGAREVRLVLSPGDAERTLPMTAEDGDVYTATGLALPPGTRYLFEVATAEGTRLRVPDPASRYQPDDVHGASCLVDDEAYRWHDAHWRGRPWEEAVIYELHVGTFTPEGTFAALSERLDYFVELGVTALELMPLSDFPGARNWGYDGVLPFAPDSAYGTPDDLKRLVDAAHQRGIMVFLDVVYNHLGPDGNYLAAYARPFFNPRRQTPWGDALDFANPAVRRFFVDSACHWLSAFHLDGLRFDAVHAIDETARARFLEDIAARVRREHPHRHVHLMLENDDNETRYLRDGGAFAAQWNDDLHHVLHVLMSHETQGYYLDYADRPIALLGKALSEGLVYQGQPSAYRDGRPRGQNSCGVPLTRFVSFIQNHDQVGNRAFGERVTAYSPAERVYLASAIYLLSPQIPMLFMGEEWASERPFPFFCDFHDALAAAVTAGRREEFARFAEFQDPEQRARIPDPNAPSTFESAVLDWTDRSVTQSCWLRHYKTLIALRRQFVVPLLRRSGGRFEAQFEILGDEGLEVSWRYGGETLRLYVNFSLKPLPCHRPVGAELVYETHEDDSKRVSAGEAPPLSVVWFLAGVPA